MRSHHQRLYSTFDLLTSSSMDSSLDTAQQFHSQFTKHRSFDEPLFLVLNDLHGLVIFFDEKYASSLYCMLLQILNKNFFFDKNGLASNLCKSGVLSNQGKCGEEWGISRLYFFCVKSVPASCIEVTVQDSPHLIHPCSDPTERSVSLNKIFIFTYFIYIIVLYIFIGCS